MSDNHHVAVCSSQISCGVAQVYNITSDAEKVLYAIATQLYHPARGSPYAFLTWSDTEDSNGLKLANFIDSLYGKLSGFPINQTNWAENPKTSNKICIWVWEIPHEELKKWYLNQRMVKASKL